MNHQQYFSVDSNEIYHRDHQRIERYFVQSTNTNQYEANEDSKEKCECIPNDTVHITHIKNRTIQIFQKFTFQSLIPREPNDFTKHIKFLPIWKQLLLKNCKEPATTEPIISVIQQNRTLLISSDGSKSSEKSGEGWIIADVEGREILSGFNPDFGDITQINTHRAEIYGALSVSMFFHEYCKFYKMKLKSPINYYCDNKEVVTKLINITEKDRTYY